MNRLLGGSKYFCAAKLATGSSDIARCVGGGTRAQHSAAYLARASKPYFTADECVLSDLQELVEGPPEELSNRKFASEIKEGVVIYDASTLPMTDPALQRDIQTEIASVFESGCGIVVLKNAWDHKIVDEVTVAFNEIIDSAGEVETGDHFAKPGANSRIWNASEKLAIGYPDLFVDYYSNQVLATVSNAWLGPAYQVTSQVNVVKPGGDAQTCHRDYHLGFRTVDQAASYPARVHNLCPTMTLQGAVAHCDMPLETGPTTYLPHSHKYEVNYSPQP